MPVAEATSGRLSGGTLDLNPETVVSGHGPFVNEGLALRVGRASDVGQTNLIGAQTEAAVDLIGRCLSSRAVGCRV